MRPRTSLFVLAFAALAAAAPIAHADLIAADNRHGFSSFLYAIGIGRAGNTPSFGVFANEAAGQRFIAQASGTVTTLDATVFHNHPGSSMLTIGIYTTSAGGTVGTLLGQETFGPSDVPPANGAMPFNTFDLAGANVALTAGQSYFVMFTTDQSIANDTRYDAYLSGNPAYPFGFNPVYSPDGGVSWANSTTPYEIGLTIHFVPDPASAAAGTTFLAGTLAFRRRRGKRPGRRL